MRDTRHRKQRIEQVTCDRCLAESIAAFADDAEGSPVVALVRCGPRSRLTQFNACHEGTPAGRRPLPPRTPPRRSSLLFVNDSVSNESGENGGVRGPALRYRYRFLASYR